MGPVVFRTCGSASLRLSSHREYLGLGFFCSDSSIPSMRGSFLQGPSKRPIECPEQPNSSKSRALNSQTEKVIIGWCYRWGKYHYRPY